MPSPIEKSRTVIHQILFYKKDGDIFCQRTAAEIDDILQILAKHGIEKNATTISEHITENKTTKEISHSFPGENLPAENITAEIRDYCRRQNRDNERTEKVFYENRMPKKFPQKLCWLLKDNFQNERKKLIRASAAIAVWELFKWLLF